MHKAKTVAAAAALLLSCTTAAQAEYRTTYGAFSATGSVSSDYRFRGISQTDKKPALQLGAEWNHDSGFYVGAWGSNVDFNDGGNAAVETDVYGGYRFNVNGILADFGAIGYLYPGARDSMNYDFWEAKAHFSYDLGSVATVNAAAHYSPDFFGGSGGAFYTSLGASAPVPNTPVRVNGKVGHQTVEKNTPFGGIPDYNTWTLGVDYGWQGFDFSASYVDTSVSNSGACRRDCDAAAVVGVSKAF